MGTSGGHCPPLGDPLGPPFYTLSLEVISPGLQVLRDSFCGRPQPISPPPNEALSLLFGIFLKCTCEPLALLVEQHPQVSPGSKT